jgi:hypothetical protein
MDCNSDDQSAHNVDYCNYDTGNDVPFDELHRSVHRTVKLAFFGQSKTQFSSLIRIDHTASHVGIDTHLFTGHRIQGEARCNFGYTLGTFCHNNKLNDCDDQKDDAPDNKVATHNKISETEDDFTRICMEQNLSCSGYFYTQSKQSCDQ